MVESVPSLCGMLVLESPGVLALQLLKMSRQRHTGRHEV